MNICMCGSENGFPHPSSCPYPYYGGSPKLMAEWELAKEKLLADREAAEKGEMITFKDEQ